MVSWIARRQALAKDAAFGPAERCGEAGDQEQPAVLCAKLLTTTPPQVTRSLADPALEDGNDGALKQWIR